MTDSQSAPQPTKAKTSWLKQLLAVAFCGVLLWLAFRDKDLDQILHHMQSVDPKFILAACVSGLFSHYLRAARWIIFLEPVAKRKISLWNSFYSIIIGYAVNIVIPRGGEVARLVSISKKESIPWAGVLPTMFIDRLIDLAFLAGCTGLTLTLLQKVKPEVIDQVPWLIPGGISLLVLSLVGLALLPKAASIMRFFTSKEVLRSKIPARLITILDDLTAQFDVGTSCLTKATTFPIIALQSFLMWFCYFLNFYLMIFAFNLQDQVDLSAMICIFTIGSVGVLVPTPGSAGGFHYLVSTALSLMTTVDPNKAAAYATLLHVIAFLVITC
ncbi:MAG: flippase-like domain-containing protein, partial [Cyanobacteria bacterium]|nr:flippase-like domain-containing protein [Cyanobacteriota bacterium]